MRPRIFLGSSTEGLPVAEVLYACFERPKDMTPTLWKHDIFYPGQYVLEALEEQLYSHDFAVLVASPDDRITKRQATSPAMRDNVLFELGLFTGSLGRSRTFFVRPTQPKIDLPSDLVGVVATEYDSERVAGGELAAAVERPCREIRMTIEREWQRKKEADEETKKRLYTSEVGQAVKRMSTVAMQFRDALLVLQRDALSALTNEHAFEDAKRRASKKVAEIADAFSDEANLTATTAELSALARATDSALLDLPFPSELSVGSDFGTEQALSLGVQAFEAWRSGADPMRPIRREASREAQGRARGLQERYAEWWDCHGPKLQETTTAMQDALIRVAIQLATDVSRLR